MRVRRARPRPAARWRAQRIRAVGVRPHWSLLAVKPVVKLVVNMPRALPQTVPEPLRFDGTALHVLDQRRLPAEVVEERAGTVEAVFEAISSLKVRGAPAIGIAAAWGMVLAMRATDTRDPAAWREGFERTRQWLVGARPTAVNLDWALRRLQARVAATPDAVGPLQWALEAEAAAIHEEDRAVCRAIGHHGLAVIRPDIGVLTHCNAGSLAVSERGTALAPLYEAHGRGIPFRVYADETRPVLQGARLTAWELDRVGIDVTLICDGMAAHLMAEGRVDVVIVGTDRITANGDVVNKIGTLALAVLARHFGIPFYVACPASTWDPATPTGEEVTIEERPDAEVTHVAGQRIAPEGVKVRNPAFDVTPAELVTGVITERGIAEPPIAAGLRALLGANVTNATPAEPVRR